MITRAQLIWLAALIGGDLLVGAICFGFLPSRSPIHWNLQGQVDGYGSPWEVAFLIPIINAATAGLVLGIATIPQIATALARSGPIFGRMVIAGVVGLIAVHALVLLAAFDKPIDFSRAMFVILGLLLAVLGNWMGKLRRNQIAGIRTPWTLKSEVVWERTHRIGGPLMVALGLVVMLAVLLLPFWVATALLVVGVVAFTIWSFAYSWWIYRDVGKGQHLA